MCDRHRRIVCHLSTVHGGYDARIWERECVTLSQSGYSVHLFVPHESRLKYKGVQVHPLKRWRSRYQRFFYGRSAAEDVLKVQPDIIHFHDPELLPVMLSLKKNYPVKIVFDCHEDTISHIILKDYIPESIKPFLRRTIEYYFKKAALNLDAVVTADEGMRRQFVEWGAQAVTLFNFPPREIYAAEPNWDFASRPYDVIYPGSTPKYHLEAMFKIARELRRRGYPTKWLILADFKFEDAQRWINARLEALELTECFDFQQPVALPSLPEFLQTAKIGIIPLPDTPKFHHNIPSKLFDFLLAGLPVVLSDLPPSRPFISNHNVAISVRAGDIGGYARAIGSLLSNQSRMVEMGKEARGLALKNFTWETQVEKLLSLYETLLTQEERRGDPMAAVEHEAIAES
jgi:glycosyltransferase involved in cell wall biosynthesis